MKRKLIAMDLDGTAVDAAGRLAPGVKEAIAAARAQGHMVAFVTGRADTDMAPLDCEYDFVDYLILNNGAKLVCGRDGRVLDNEVLNRDEVERLIRFCQEQGVALRAVISEPGCVDVMNPGINKWNGLEALLRLIRMEREDVVAIGDYDNDLEMILQSGIGVAVGNARECVKAGADYVTVRDNEAGAAADAINELVLGAASGLCLKNGDRKSTRLNSSHNNQSRMPSSA